VLPDDVAGNEQPAENPAPEQDRPGVEGDQPCEEPGRASSHGRHGHEQHADPIVDAIRHRPCGLADGFIGLQNDHDPGIL